MGYEVISDEKPLAPSQKRYGRNYLVRKTFAILRSFRDMDECLTSRDLAQRAQIPNSSGHRIVSTLEEIGALSRGQRGRYQPGFLLASLGLSVDFAQALKELSLEIASGLSFRLGLNVQIAVLQDGIVHIVLETSARGALVTGTRTETCLDPFASAVGRVLLADLSEGRLERLLSVSRQTRPLLQDAEAVKDDLAQVKRDGFAWDKADADQLSCVAVPIFDRNGHMVAALSVKVRGNAPGANQDIINHLSSAAAAIRRRTGPPI